MKTIFTKMIWLVVVMNAMSGFGQRNIKYAGEDFNIPIKKNDELKYIPLYYRYQIDSLNSTKNNITFNAIFLKADSTIDEIDKSTKDDLDSPFVYNNNLLNILFAEEVGKYFNGGSDLSMQRYSFSLSTEDNSFAFGYNLIDRDKAGKKSKPLRYVINLGLKASASGKLSTIVKDGKSDNADLGVTGKFTFVGSGTINYKGKYDQIASAKNSYQKFYKKKSEEYISEFNKKYNDSINILFVSAFKNDEERKKLLKSTAESFYNYINENELKVFKERKLYKNYHVYWCTFDVFLPVNEKKYLFTDQPVAQNKTNTEKLWAFSSGITFTYLHKKPNDKTWFISGQISGKNNNNVLVDEMKTKPFQTIIPQTLITEQVIDSSQDVYVFENGATYEEFFTTSARFEVVYFIKKWIGFSPAIEFNMGEYYKKTNFKIGVPFSLKDKDDKPSVNLEIQYRKVNSSDVFGLNASYIFGKFLK